MALSPIAVWAGAAAATLAVAGAGAAFWVHENRGMTTLPGLPEFAEIFPASPPGADLKPAASAPAASPKPPSDAAGGSRAVASKEQPAATAPPAIKPTFDVVNVSPAGETVVAGRAAPNAKVELRDSGKTLGVATADAGGQFVIIPEPLSPGKHQLSLATGEGGAAENSNPIAVAVAEPAKASASDASPVAAAASGRSPPAIAVKSVEVGPGGRFVAKGAASPNAIVRLYLSGAFVGDARTKQDGRWSLTIENGMTPGAYTVRADEVRPDGSVLARAEAPFDFPKTVPDDQRPPGNVVASAGPASAADVVLFSVRTAHVQPGDTLWGLSQTFYGDGSRYQLIFAANNEQIRDPNLIYPGQAFILPKPEPKP